MELIDELCSFEARRAGTDAERRAANWLAKRLRDARPPRRRRADLRAPSVRARPRRSTARSAFAGSLVAILAPAVGFAIVLRRRGLDVPRPERPLLPRCAACSSAARPRTSSRPASGPRRPRASSSAPTTTPPGRAASSSPSASRAASRLAKRLPFPIAPVPRPLLVARAPAPDPRRPDGRRRLRPDLAPPAAPHADPVDRRLPARRHRALRRRPRRQRQRLGRRHRPLAGRGARRRAARRTSTSGSCSPAPRSARWRACAPSSAPTASSSTARTPTSSSSTRSGRATCATRPARAWRSRTTWTSASCSSATRSRPPTARTATASAPSRCARHSPPTPCPPASQSSARPPITCLDDGSLLPANYHRPEDVPERIDRKALDRAHDFTLELVRALDRDVGRRSRAEL